MITEQNKSLKVYAMHFGTAMGLFWIFKFIFLPLGFKIPFLQLLFLILTCFVPFVGYKFAKIYRDKYSDGEINFTRAYVFLIFMYFFAALLTSAGHFIYFNFIDDGFIVNTYTAQLEQLKSEVSGELEASVDQLIETFNIISDLTSRQITLQLFFQNIFYGSLLALPTALAVVKRKKQN